MTRHWRWQRNWRRRLRRGARRLFSAGTHLVEALRGAGLSDPESLNLPQALGLLDAAQRPRGQRMRR